MPTTTTKCTCAGCARPISWGRPAWFSVDDSEVMKLSQDGVAPHPNAAGVIELGGRDIEDADHMVTETAIRGFYRYYCRVMGF